MLVYSIQILYGVSQGKSSEMSFCNVNVTGLRTLLCEYSWDQVIFISSVLVQHHLAAVGAGEEDGQRLLFFPRRYNWITWGQSNIRERLYDSNRGARGFHQRKVLWEPSDSQASRYRVDWMTMELTAKAKPRSAMKGYIPPSNVRKFRTLPPLRSKLIGIITIEVFSSVQVVGQKSYTYSAGYEQWSIAVWTAAAG